MTKLILVLLIFIVWMGCDTQAENDPQQLRLYFEYPKIVQPEIDRFDIYWWQGDDPVVYDSTMLTLISTVDPDSFFTENDSMYIYYSDNHTVVLNYVGAGSKAANDSGQVSRFSITEIHTYWQFFRPPAPISGKITR